MNRHIFRGSRTNRDRRDQAASLIAEATRRFNETEARNTATLANAGLIEVCPDCYGSGEVIRYVSDLHVNDAVCLECNGKGWVS